MTWRNVLTTLIYAFAALAACFLWLIRSDAGFPSNFPLTPSLLFLGPLLFVFAYPKFLFAGADGDTKSLATRVRSAAVLHGMGAVAATIAFEILASSWRHNPLFNARSVTFFATTIAADLLFLAAAILMLAKRRAILPLLASFLLWPYWLGLALASAIVSFERKPTPRSHFSVSQLLFSSPSPPGPCSTARRSRTAQHWPPWLPRPWSTQTSFKTLRSEMCGPRSTCRIE